MAEAPREKTAAELELEDAMRSIREVGEGASSAPDEDPESRSTRDAAGPAGS